MQVCFGCFPNRVVRSLDKCPAVEKEIPSGGSQAGNISQSSCPKTSPVTYSRLYDVMLGVMLCYIIPCHIIMQYDITGYNQTMPLAKHPSA